MGLYVIDFISFCTQTISYKNAWEGPLVKFKFM